MRKKTLISIVSTLIILIVVCFSWDAFVFYNFETVSAKEIKTVCVESSEQTVTNVQVLKKEMYPKYLFAICSVEKYDGTNGDEMFLFEQAYYLNKYETERYKIKKFSQAVSTTKEVGSLFCEIKNIDDKMEEILVYFSSNKNNISTVSYSFEDKNKNIERVNDKEAFLIFITDPEVFNETDVFKIEFFNSRGDSIYSEISKRASIVKR